MTKSLCNLTHKVFTTCTKLMGNYFDSQPDANSSLTAIQPTLDVNSNTPLNSTTSSKKKFPESLTKLLTENGIKCDESDPPKVLE